MRGGVTCSMAAARAIMHAVTSSVPAQADRLMEETISGYRRGDFARVDFSRGVGGGAELSAKILCRQYSSISGYSVLYIVVVILYLEL
jgi:hypothetical protein